MEKNNEAKKGYLLKLKSYFMLWFNVKETE